MKLLLAHGASGTAKSMEPWVHVLARHGVEAAAIDVRRGGQPPKAVEDWRRALEANSDSAIGGHSFGGRMASMLAAEQPVEALVLLSYPLHRPGHPEQLRTEHWPSMTCPVLLLSGESDPFARIALLREAVHLLSSAELVTYPGQGHGLLSVRDNVAGRISQFLAGIHPIAR